MNIYYLDDPLNEDDLTFLRESIAGFDDIRSIQSMEQKRVPNVLPLPDENGKYDKDTETHIEIVKNSLFRAGIEGDVGTQVTWVMPKTTYWGVIFQTAIMEITGHAPYVAQSWYYEEDELVKGDMRVIDGHGMFGGKD